MWQRLVVNVLGITLVPVALATAQVTPGGGVTTTDERASRSHWGVTGAVTPTWEFYKPLGELFDKDITMSGTAFEAGFVRGRELSGDWGVSIVRKQVKNGSTARDSGTSCISFASEPPVCPKGTTYATQDMSLLGIEIHKFVPFVTIQRRVQIGMNFGGGVARLEGQAIKSREEIVTTFDPVRRQPVFTLQEQVPVTVEARELLDGFDILPLAKMEVAIAVIAAPGLKVRISGGIDAPGYSVMRLTAVYLIGAR